MECSVRGIFLRSHKTYMRFADSTFRFPKTEKLKALFDVICVFFGSLRPTPRKLSFPLNFDAAGRRWIWDLPSQHMFVNLGMQGSRKYRTIIICFHATTVQTRLFWLAGRVWAALCRPGLPKQQVTQQVTHR